MPSWPYRLVTFDIDGTLTTGHGWESIARYAGRLDAYRGMNRRFLAGDVGEDEHLRELLELAVGLDLAAVREQLAATPKVAGIREALDALQRRGAKVALLTHNPGYVCDWYVQEFGFDGAAGTPGSSVVDGRISLVGPIRADKPAGLRTLLAQFDIPRAATCHVGDGWADARVFPTVGAGVAFNSRFPEVDRAADLALRGQPLTEVVRRLDGLPPRAV